ncbi:MULTISPECIES: type VI secretion system baseplate subunit TssG [Alcaligenes]|uniref:type VI secretion system baseplate subunit TssG n=1 Tax=Alcaligenes TaxID=507 RepID=UPI003612E26A
MASANRSATPVVEAGLLQDLQTQAPQYSFFQAARLLRQHLGDDAALRERVRIRPALTLAFPESDLAKVERGVDGRFHIEANFFGLYGVTSPLPTFYTEDLIQEAMQGYSARRDFIDIVHAALYPLLYQAWEKYRIWLAVHERRDGQRLRQLYALVGLRETPERQDDAQALLPFAGNLGMKSRSALGLQSLLAGLLGGLPVRVHPCAPRFVRIAPVYRSRLGGQASRLGEDSVLGEQVLDCAGNADIEIGPLQAELFHDLLPGAPLFDRVSRTVAWYLQAPLQCELQLWLEPQQRQGACLGRGWQRLGCNTWLGQGRSRVLAERPVRFGLNLFTAENDDHDAR